MPKSACTAWNRMAKWCALCAAALVATLAMSTASAASYTYTFQFIPYDYWQGTYSGAKGISGSFTTAEPLPHPMFPGQTGGYSVENLVTGWSVSDGVFLYTEHNSLINDGDGDGFIVVTDSEGNLVASSISLMRVGDGAVVGQPIEILATGHGMTAFVVEFICSEVDATGVCTGRDNNSLLGGATSTAKIGGTAGFQPPITTSGPPLVHSMSQWSNWVVLDFTAPPTDAGKRFTAACTPADGGTTLTGTGTASPIVVFGTRAGALYSCGVTAN